MNGQDFYVLDRWPADHRERTEFFSVDANRGDAPRCPECGEFIGPLPWLPPYRAQLELLGPIYGDLAFGAGNDLLVSERVRELFASSELTVASSFDRVEIVGIRGASSIDGPVPRYWHIEVGLSAVAIDDLRSGARRHGPVVCGTCRQDLAGLDRIVLEDHPDPGADLFIARELPGTFIASARLKETFDAERVSNAWFVAAEEYSFDYGAPAA